MKSKIENYLLFIVLLLVHVVWLYTIREQIAPELVFPVWLLSNTSTFVSEVQTMYPLGLFYLVNFIYSLTEYLRLSFYLVHIAIVISLDSLLYFYLKSKFGFKNAVSGFLFYIIWQVFFRGNYLWFDLATIPFIALSFFSFSSYVKKQRQKDLLLASLFLSMGVFFKNTIMWIFILYLIWAIILTLKKQPFLKNVLNNILILISPLVLAIISNFLLLTAKSTFDFSFYWSIIMAYIIFPRLQGLSRFIAPSYLPVIFILLGFYLMSCLIIAKLSKKSTHEKWFLYTFTLAAFANVFPRWSDFHLQPFVFFLAIIVTYALSLKKFLSRRDRFCVNASQVALFLLTFAVIGNRILVEIKLAKLPKIDHLGEFTQSSFTPKLSGKSVFAYDLPFYNYESKDNSISVDSFTLFKLMITNPDLFYHMTSPQVALSYLEAKNPDFVFIPDHIQNRIITGASLTGFEKIITKKYHLESTIGTLYSQKSSAYSQKSSAYSQKSSAYSQKSSAYFVYSLNSVK